METMTKDREDVRTKTLRAEVKADAPEPGATLGTFEARVAAFGNVDLQGDRIEPEAFDATLKTWSDSGDNIPVIWSHAWDDPMAHIGWVDSAEASDEGLEVKGVIDLSTDLARQVHRLMVDRRVKEFSFAYLPTEAEPDPDDDRVRVLKALDLIEVGPTLKGANPETVLHGAKKSAIGSHETGTSDEDWDAGKMTERLPSSEAALRAAHAWRDPDGDPDAKASYKFPHHMVGEDGRVGSANLRGASSGIGALNGARGGTSIPADDRSGVYDHLARHLRDGDREVPELRSVDEDGNLVERREDVSRETVDDDSKVGPAAERKYGRVLSKANEGKLREARDLVSAVLASIRDEGSADEGEDGKSSADRGEPTSIDRTDAALRVLELGG